MFKNFLQKFSHILLIILVVVMGFCSYYFYKKYSISNKTNSLDSKNIINKVSKHIFLPYKNLPTVATVSDPSLLKDQSFFADVEIGDKVLMYTYEKKAIIYRPSIDKIINMAPIDLGNNIENQVASTSKNIDKKKVTN